MKAFLSLAQKYAYYVMGGVFVIMGGLAFLGRLPFFGADLYHNVLRVGTGFFLVQSARQSPKAMNFWGRVLGVAYGVIAILGFTMPEGDLLGYMTVGLADNIFHTVIALPLLFYGFRKPDHRPVVDHDAERAAELEKEKEEAYAAALPALQVKNISVVDLRGKEPGLPKAPVPPGERINK